MSSRSLKSGTAAVLCFILSLLLIQCGEPVVVARVTPTLDPNATAITFPTLAPTNRPTAEPTATATLTLAPTSTPSAAETALPTATPLPSPTPTQLPPPPDYFYAGLSFDYLEQLGDMRIVPETILERERQPGIGVDRGNPRYWRVSFGAAEPSEEFFRPTHAQIRVYPLLDYINLFPEAGLELQRLAENINTQNPDPDGPLPLVPLTGSLETFHAQVKYVDFENGFGMRYIAQYDQTPGPIHNSGLFYTFQGITLDTEYVVVMFYPVQTSWLPSTYETADLTPFRTDETKAAYYDEVIGRLNRMPGHVFTPSLDELDTIAASISAIDPFIAAEQQKTSDEAPDGNPAITGKIDFPGDPRTLIRVYARSTDSGQFFYTDVTTDTFEISVTPGTYNVFAYAVNTLQRGGFTTYSTCDAVDRVREADLETCGEQLLEAIPVVAEDIDGITINDWISEENEYIIPLPPDESMSTRFTYDPEAPPPDNFARIRGPINYFEPYTPSVTIYATNLETDETFRTHTRPGDVSYEIAVPAGVYIVYAYVYNPAGVAGGGYTDGDRGLLTVSVVDSGQANGIPLDNFNMPPLSLIPSVPGVRN